MYVEDDFDKKIRQMRESTSTRYTPGIISQQVGLSIWEVRVRLKKMGLSPDKRPNRDVSWEGLKTALRDGMKYKEMEEKFGISGGSICYHAKKWGLTRRHPAPMDDSLIIQKYVNEQKPLHRVAIETGFCDPRVRKRLKELGVFRGKSELHHMKAMDRARRHGSPHVLGSGGYPIVPVDPATIKTGRKLLARNRYAFLHILEAERKLGRPLTGKEIVHHIDFNRLNASPDNLIVCSDPKEHAEIHGSLERACGVLLQKNMLGFNGQRYFVRANVIEKLLGPIEVMPEPKIETTRASSDSANSETQDCAK